MTQITVTDKVTIISNDGVESIVTTDGPVKAGVCIDSQNNAYFVRVDGILHKDDGPAIVWADGTFDWRQNGKPFRADGKPTTESPKYRKWYHHEDGAIGRVGGPAFETVTGYREYWLNGQYFDTKSEYDAKCQLLGIAVVSQSDVDNSHQDWLKSLPCHKKEEI